MATKDTGGGQQKATRQTEDTEEQAEETQVSEDLKERQEELSDDVDSVLDEIDDVLEENAEDFVRSLRSEGRRVRRVITVLRPRCRGRRTDDIHGLRVWSVQDSKISSDSTSDSWKETCGSQHS